MNTKSIGFGTPGNFDENLDIFMKIIGTRRLSIDIDIEINV